MIGDQKLKTVMDVLLNDEVYLALHSVLERYNNFREEYITCNGYNGLNNIQGKHALMAYEVWRDTFLIKAISKMNGSEYNAVEGKIFVTDHPENFITGNRIVIQGNAQATDISPLSDYFEDSSVYDKIGWYCQDFSVTDEMEADLFQASTVQNVYSSFQLQEVMNRAMNLPLLKYDSLTILPDMMYHETYKNMNQILRGY